MSAIQIQLPDARRWRGALLLPDLGVIDVAGPDAAAFLHGQLSQDINGLAPDEARLAAYCSAKGRMLASMTVWRPQPEQVLILTDRQVLPGLLKRLTMFVLRAKAKLSDATGTLGVVGLLGDAVAAMGHEDPARPWQVRACDGGSLVGLPTVAGCARAMWIGPMAQAEALVARLPAPQAGAWPWLDVLSGIPRIEAATVDQFVPQMVNFELIGGVNFKKGCYPGQEVVARSQYRGTTKRRAFVVHGAVALQPGQEVFCSADPGQPAGMVVNAASVGAVHSALVELKLNAVGQDLHAGAADGPALALGELPYALPTAEEAA